MDIIMYQKNIAVKRKRQNYIQWFDCEQDIFVQITS